MPIQIVHNDITKMQCDAIVNAANSSLLGGGGVDGAIHRAAGKELLFECRMLGGCKTGQAKITAGYNLSCRYIIHTVGPVWRGGNNGEKELLESCYLESLKLAKEYKCENVAFPLISSGIYGYPKDKALDVAIDTISSFLEENDMMVYVVIFDKSYSIINEELYEDINSYINHKQVEDYTEDYSDRKCNAKLKSVFSNAVGMSKKRTDSTPMMEWQSNAGLDEIIGQMDESFSQMLLRKIDECGMTDVQCYKKANVDRKLFSKIRSDINYHPSKTTAIAFAIALELNLEETKELLMKAGFALSHSSKFDIIIEYFIQNSNYNIFEINEALFAFDQSLLGV